MRTPSLLVHLHLFYPDQTDYFIQKLKNINSVRWDLVVTYSGDITRAKEQIQAYKPDTVFMEVENVGYDVWPFIKVIRQYGTSSHDYLLKLHTKNTDNHKNRVNGIKLQGTQWRDMLVDALVGNAEVFRKTITRMEADKTYGMACNAMLLRDINDNQSDHQMLVEKELRRIHFNPTHHLYCSGTMFLARMEKLKRIEALDIDSTSFPSKSAAHSRNTLAHIYESIIGLMALSEGARPLPIVTSRCRYYRFRMGRTLKTVTNHIFSLERKGPQHIKTLTLLGIQFKLE